MICTVTVYQIKFSICKPLLKQTYTLFPMPTEYQYRSMQMQFKPQYECKNLNGINM